MTGTSVDRTSDADPTPTEVETALAYLAETARGLTQAVRGLDEAQWSHRADSDRWSIAEILEHLALLEELFVTRLVLRLRDAPAGSATRDAAAEDARLRALVSDRSEGTRRAKAPSQITPTGRWTPEDALLRFRDARTRTAEFLRTAKAGLRGRVMEHPALGVLDGFQWVLFLAAHSVRHTSQILELRASAGFPSSGTDHVDGPAETAEYSTDGLSEDGSRPRG